MKIRFLRLCSIALIFALLLNLLPAQAITLKQDEIRISDTYKEILSEENGTEEFVNGSAVIIAEIPEKRTAFTKDYMLSNGYYMSVVYPEVVHYEDNGQWKEIDNTLKVSGTGNNRVYTNAAGGWNVIFPQQMRNDNRVSVVKDGYTVSFGMAGELRSSAELMGEANRFSSVLSVAKADVTEETTVMQMQVSTAQIAQKASVSDQAKVEHPEIVREKLYSRLTYEDVYNNVDIVYDLNGYQLKESIVISSYDATVRGYQYVLETGSLIPVLNDDGSIDLFTQIGQEVVMKMPAPYMIDSAGNVNYDVEVSLAPCNGGYMLTYRTPSSWLAEPDRAWPVVLDPVILAESHWNNILDQFVAENYSPSFTAGSLFCGYHHDLGKMRTFIQYANLPALTSADVIVHAELSLQYLAGGSENTSVIEAHKVNTTWDSQTITWQNQPGHSAIVEDYAIVSADQRYSWGITDLVRDWYASVNTGVMLKMPDNVETGTVTNWKKFYSVDYSMYAPQIWPYLNIVYRNTNGLESYWDYTASSAGRAGTGYINNYSGNLVWVRDDIGFGGNRMPVTISHIYNANDSAVDTFGMGYGWRTNFNQLVYQWVADTDYYIWEDGDGTKHYFLYNAEKTKYLDEDGLELELTVNTSDATATYCITDKYGNASYFDSYGRLCRMTNNEETPSSIIITYSTVSGKNILNITDGVGRRYGFSYDGALLERIGYYGTGTTELSYVDFIYSGNQLTRITDKDGKSCYYTYGTNNLLTSAQDVDGYQLTYTYNTMTTGQPNRIKTVVETDDGTSGGTLSVEYAKNQTTFTDYNGNVQIMQFNNLGNTVSIQDDQGRAQFAQYALNDTLSSASSTAKGNQLTMSSKLQNTVGNIQSDSSFENGVTWGTLHSDRVTGYVTTEEAYIGNKSLAMVRETNGEISGLYSQSFTIPAGETYTFSAYVKTGAGNACLAISNGTITQYSDYLDANSDWTRLEVSYTNYASVDVSVTARVQTAQAGTVYMDCVQIERAPTASRYNLIDNGDFRNTYSWSSTSGIITPSNLEAAAPELNNTVYSMTGSPTATNGITQTVPVSGSAGDTFVLAGWAKGDSVPLGEVNNVTREFGMKLTFHNTDGSTDTQSVSFNCDLPSDGNWQYVATPAVAKKAYSSVTVELVYHYNANTVYFDGIQLYKEEFGNSYTYDDEGNVTSVKDLQNQTTTYEYTNNNLTKAILPTGAELTYTYDNHHNVKTATTSTGIVYSFTYDTYGNNTSVSISNGTTTITSSASYTTDGNRMLTSTDDLENVTTYCYNENTNVLEWVQYPNDTVASRTTYMYDNMYRLASSASAVAGLSSGTALTANYTYTDDLLTAIQTGSTTYSFSYGKFAQRSSIQIGSRTLVSYEYTSDPNRYLDKLTYGNGDYITYDYDSQGRVILETFKDGSTVSYQYDNAGALATMTDSATGRKTTYYYDLTDRLMKYVESGSDYKHSAEYGYDNLNNLNWLAETINGVEHTTNYTYDEDNRLTGTTYVDLANGNDVSESIEYDAYGRMSITRVKNNDELVLGSWFQYTYSNTSFSDTTHLGGLMVYGASGYTLNSYYSYDANGNITRYSMTGGNDAELLSLNTDNPVRMGEVYYHYDTANQLVREDNMWLGKTFVWSYDDAGNITSCKEYEYIHNTDPVSGTPKKTNTYTYGDSSWGDLVTVRNGTQWSYDQIGNLVTDGTWTYLWNNGRELEYICSSFANWYCTYDANGMRTSRSSDTKTYTYVYNGSQLTQMTVGNDTLYFTYGAIGPTTVTWNGTTYYYAVNGQGDVIGIFDGSGNCVVTYNWDNAWGDNPKPEGTMAATLGTLNPLRYRSYVYDTETELYYLQSRYYNPEIGRFINADAFVSTGQGLLGNNMFAYCGNNPGSRLDISGCAFTDIFAVCFGEVINLPNYLDKSYEIGDRSIISKGTISINMVEEAENIRELSNYLSVETISIAIAISACDKYYATYGEEFLLSDLCVAYEIEEHIYAYYFSTGNRAVPNLLVAGYYVMQIVQNGSYAAGSIYSATRMIDMRESDVVVNGYQAIVFGYKHGIRDTYIGTDRDPWASSR